MAKKPMLAANGENGKTKAENKRKSRSRNSTSSDTLKNSNTRSKTKISKNAGTDAASKECEVTAPRSLGEESQDEVVVESGEAEEENGVATSTSEEEEEEKEKEKKKSRSKGKNLFVKNEGNKRIKKEEVRVINKGKKRIKKEEEDAKGNKGDVKNKGKKRVVKEENEDEDARYGNEGKRGIARSKGNKRIKKEEENEEDAEEKCENVLYTFPMNRIKCIIKDEIPDLRISQEAVFLINIASEKFLKLFAKEAYACTFLDQKSYTAYNHLSSVVSKRKRFGFLSDFVPEKLKAEDALAKLAEDEKLEN